MSAPEGIENSDHQSRREMLRGLLLVLGLGALGNSAGRAISTVNAQNSGSVDNEERLHALGMNEVREKQRKAGRPLNPDEVIDTYFGAIAELRTNKNFDDFRRFSNRGDIGAAAGIIAGGVLGFATDALLNERAVNTKEKTESKSPAPGR